MKVRTIGSILAGVSAVLATVAGSAHAGNLRWSGQVDDTATIRIFDRNVRTTANYHGVQDTRFDFDGKLPNRPTRVRLVRDRGRGNIEIIEQPSARNNYTAVVRIKDSDPGSSRYAFQLQWEDNSRNGRDRGGRDDDRDNRWDNRGRRPF